MRKWIKSMSPRHVNALTNCYSGQWMPQMDRCWQSDDGFCVMSRLLRTKWGKVEHVTIIKVDKNNIASADGSRDISWATKQEIKNELFGANKTAIEVFPSDKYLVDECDVYHLWVFEKGFELPFGIHPKQFKLAEYVNRGFSFTENEGKEYLKMVENSEVQHEEN